MDISFLLRLSGAFLAAGCVAFIVFLVIGSLQTETTAAKALREFRAGSSAGDGTRYDQQAEMGDRIARRLPIPSGTWENHLAWAQRGGYYAGQRLGNVFFLAVLYFACGVVLIFLMPIPILFLVPFLAAAFPFIGLRARANKVRRRAIRALPDVAALVSAEVAAGTPADQAILRASQLPGPMATLLQETEAFSRQTGRPLFGRKPVAGALVEVFSRTGLSQLRAFALQLDEIANKGVDAPLLMNDMARALSQEYRERVMMEKEKLDGTLTRHVAFHFFMPAVVLILAAFFIPVLDIMTK